MRGARSPIIWTRAAMSRAPSRRARGFLKASTRDPRLLAAGAALCENRIPEAEALLRAHLQRASDRRRRDPHARRSRRAARALRRTPNSCWRAAWSSRRAFHAARHNYAVVLHPPGQARRGAAARSSACSRAEPRNPSYRNLKAAILAASASTRARSRSTSEVLARVSRAARKVWMSYGHALKTAGRQAERRSTPTATRIELEPASARRTGASPTSRPSASTPPTSRAMRAQLARERPDATRTAFTFDFALGKALEDARRVRGVVRALRATATRCGARSCTTTPTTHRDHVARAQRAVHAASSSRARAGSGCPARRSDLHRRPAARRLDADRADPVEPLAGRRHDGAARHASRSRSALRRAAAGATSAAIRDVLRDAGRRTSCARSASDTSSARASSARPAAPFFIDKMPNNFVHVGLDPSDAAEREDHRRAPPSARLLLLGLQAALRARPELHLRPRRPRPLLPRLRRADGALRRGAAGPRAPRASTRTWSRTPKREVRRLLDYCGLPFEDACLRFYENERAVRTASSEQVRSRSTATASISGGTSSPGSGR